MRYVLLLLLLICRLPGQGQTPDYGVSKVLWEDSLGNHRVVVDVDKATDYVEVKVDWRRRDHDADKKVLIITDASGKVVKNIKIISINREQGDFIFGPVSGGGRYYVYYMPWSGHKWEGGFQGDYLHEQPGASQDWLSAVLSKSTKIPLAAVVRIQARTAFDSFFPMEIVAKQTEVDALVNKHSEAALVFMEDRKHPIKMFDDLPFRWIEKGPEDTFSDTAEINEYFVFQAGLFASRKALSNIKVVYNDAPFPVTCFNLGGIDSKGVDFKKNINLAKGRVQPLWFGVDVPKNAKAGAYSFKVQILADGGFSKSINIHLQVKNKVLADRGDQDLWRLSRLRWLNSRLGINELNTLQYAPLVAKDRTINTKNASVQLDKLGLPAQILIGQKNLLTAPIDFNIESSAATGKTTGRDMRFTHQASGKVQWESSRQDGRYQIHYYGSMEADGYLKYRIVVKANENVALDNISLNLPVRKELSTYFMGMGSGKPFGLNGGYTPFNYDWKWKGPQNSFWIGSYEAGLYCKLIGASYNGPMLNLYHPAPPPSWYNDDRGGFKIRTEESSVHTSTFTGKILLQKDSLLSFEFSFLITPVKQLDTHAQFSNRYYQNYGNPYPPQGDVDAGVNVINVHHANRINPYINYPFVMVDSMKAFVNHYHALNVKTKIYYTIRELSNQCAEIWALRSLGTEVFSDGTGGGYPWLREHLVSHYDVQWFTPIDGYEACDAAIKTSGDSRWYNYYVEGLRWLVKNVGIDGLYLDDVAFDRDMLKRMRKVMDMVKPGCMIDLHSNTDFSKGPATQYAEFFPYINKLWFGENFHYEKMQPDNWMVETSGIPFGLMGDMLFSGGNPWRGLVYGMTNRDGWPTDGKLCNPKPIWKELDRFGIRKSKMFGYWLQDKAVSTSDPDVKATVYKNGDKLLIAVASWMDKPGSVRLKINWDRLGMKPRKVIFVANNIADFQKQAKFKGEDSIIIEPGKGWLLDVE